MLSALWIFIPDYMRWDFENGDVNGLFKFIVAGIALLGLQSSGGFLRVHPVFLPPVRDGSVQDCLVTLP